MIDENPKEKKLRLAKEYISRLQDIEGDKGNDIKIGNNYTTTGRLIAISSVFRLKNVECYVIKTYSVNRLAQGGKKLFRDAESRNFL